MNRQLLVIERYFTNHDQVPLPICVDPEAILLKAAVRFRDSISLQRTVQAEMYPERAG